MAHLSLKRVIIRRIQTFNVINRALDYKLGKFDNQF